MQQAVTRLQKRQKIPLSCHNNPNLLEDGTTLVKKSKHTHTHARAGMAVINVATSEGAFGLMFLSNGLIAQLILAPVLFDAFKGGSGSIFSQISTDTG